LPNYFFFKEEAEKKKFEKERRSKIDLQLKKLQKKQEAEYQSLIKKIDSGFEALRKERLKEFEKIFQKSRNFKAELEIQHDNNFKRFERNLKNPGIKNKKKNVLYEKNSMILTLISIIIIF
jgi:hypothetical protein